MKTNEPGAAAPETKEKRVPLRRVGSFTLGVCLTATGLLLLCFYFVPGFDAELVLKIAPAAGLVLLGGEVLVYAARQEQWRYDYLSVLICLLLMAGCLCLTALPALLEQWNPENKTRAARLADDYRDSVYADFCAREPQIALRNVECALYLTHAQPQTQAELAGLSTAERHLRLTVELYGPYADAAAFAQDCARLTGLVGQQDVQPDVLTFESCPEAEWASLSSGALTQTERYKLTLRGPVQLDWSAEEMARETEAVSLLDEENEPEEPDTAEEADDEDAE